MYKYKCFTKLAGARVCEMQPEVRAALTNLKGMLDEGFVTQAEYNGRRKAIIDGATALPEGLTSKVAKKKTGAAADDMDMDDRWDHSGYMELHGSGRKVKGGKLRSAISKPNGKAGPNGKAAKPRLSGLSHTAGARVSAGAISDLRSQLGAPVVKGGRGGRSGGRASAGRGGRGGRGELPAKCPW